MSGARDLIPIVLNQSHRTGLKEDAGLLRDKSLQKLADFIDQHESLKYNINIISTDIPAVNVKQSKTYYNAEFDRKRFNISRSRSTSMKIISFFLFSDR